MLRGAIRPDDENAMLASGDHSDPDTVIEKPSRGQLRRRSISNGDAGQHLSLELVRRDD
jgi:hypothetical protein